MKQRLFFSRLFERSLWVEIFTDLSSMFGILYLIKLAGRILCSDGWLGLWISLIKFLEPAVSPHQVYVFGNVLVLLVVYWIPATLYTLVDIFKPEKLYRYKVQKKEAQVLLELEPMLTVVGTVLLNQIVQGIIGGEVAWRWRYQYINMDTPLTEVPSFGR